MWEFSRAEAYGGSAVCVTVLLAVLRVGMVDASLGVAVWAAAIGAPLLVASAAMYQFYLAIGEESAEHYRGHKFWIMLPLGLGLLAVFVAVAAVVAHLNVLASNVFGLLAFGLLFWLGGWNLSLNRWWQSRK